MHTIEARLAERDLHLPTPAAPVATYTPFVIHNDLLMISGQLPFQHGNVVTGTLGDTLDTAQGAAAAEACALMILAQAKAACEGDLSRLERCLKLGGFVACTATYTDHPKVINGASDLIGFAMGENGVHARAAVGVPSLPLGAAVEIEAIFSIQK